MKKLCALVSCARSKIAIDSPQHRSCASQVVGTVVFARATVAVLDPLEGRAGAKTPEQEVAEILPLEVDAAGRGVCWPRSRSGFTRSR